MKADIPDKILINRGEDGKIHHSYWTTDQELVPFEDTIYIRKDTLLEWLKPEKDISFPEDYERGCIDGRNGLREELIDKLNSM